jgi:hypothetical protein
VRSPLVTLCIVATVNESRLQLYLDAEAKILGGQIVRMGDRQLQRADLAEVRVEIARLQAAVNREQAAAAGRGGRFSQADFGGCA